MSREFADLNDDELTEHGLSDEQIAMLRTPRPATESAERSTEPRDETESEDWRAAYRASAPTSL